MREIRWYIGVILVPIASAVSILITRWGEQNLAGYILFPPIVCVIRIAFYVQAKPNMKEIEKEEVSPKHKLIWRAYNLEVLSLFFLFIFEAVTAGVAESAPHIALVIAILTVFFIPYLSLSLASKYFLSKSESCA